MICRRKEQSWTGVRRRCIRTPGSLTLGAEGINVASPSWRRVDRRRRGCPRRPLATRPWAAHTQARSGAVTCAPASAHRYSELSNRVDVGAVVAAVPAVDPASESPFGSIHVDVRHVAALPILVRWHSASEAEHWRRPYRRLFGGVR